MNYPYWDVPVIGSGWVIGIIAIFHVLVSHFAVGGGFYLPIAEAKARARDRLGIELEEEVRTLGLEETGSPGS